MRSKNRNPLAALAGATALALATSMLAACGGGAQADGAGADPALVSRGEGHFMTTCATCHGKDAMGLPKLGKQLRMNEFVKTHDDTELLGLLASGRPAAHPLNTTGVDMPPKGGNPVLTDEDLKAIVAYLRTLQ